MNTDPPKPLLTLVRLLSDAPCMACQFCAFVTVADPATGKKKKMLKCRSFITCENWASEFYLSDQELEEEAQR